MSIPDLSHTPQPHTVVAWIFASCLPSLSAVAEEAGIFHLLAHEPKSAEQLAQKYSWHLRGTQCLLDCLVAAQVLTRQNEQYTLKQPPPEIFQTLKQNVSCLVEAIEARLFEQVDVRGFLPASTPPLWTLGITENCRERQHLTEAGRRYFLPGTDEYLGAYVKYLWQLLGQLMACWPEVLRTGQPVIRAEKNPALFGPLGEALFPVNYVPAQQLAASLDLPAGAQILDVGAGSCAWSIPLARRYPRIQVDALDLAPVLMTTSRPFTQRYGVEHCYRFVAGDLSRLETADELHHYDLILLGHVCCILSPEENQALFHECATRLKPGGKLITIDFLPKSDRSGPLLDVLFALMMVGTNEAGNPWPRESYEEWCRCAGLTSFEWKEVSAASTPLLWAHQGAKPLLIHPSSAPVSPQKQASDGGFVPPTPIIEGSFAFAQSCMLLASVELDLYTHINAGVHTLEQLAEKAGVDQAFLERLLGGLLAMGLVRRAGPLYELTPVSARYLVRGLPTYLGDVALQIRQEWPAWIDLTKVVKTGQSIRAINEEPLGGRFSRHLTNISFLSSIR
ncbi:MAG TPA: class I SAM-dependent methyltransferase [Ktedonobacteraceae bacterium]|nr:class I SAM-dependent methyltransferase [Ktedonobacteraceae bacterium]